MPRVDGTYTAPYPDVIPDTTIESEVHNGTVADLVLDANAPRPITAGGTGGTSPATARDNLDAMVAGVQITNYDSHLWENGSFWSAPGATGAPNSGASFTGFAALVNGNQSTVSLTATDQVTGLTYHRVKNTTWDAWVVTDLSDKVSVIGDTMTGNLVIAKATPTLELQSTAGTDGRINAKQAGLTKWEMVLGLGVGGDFILNSYDDAGAIVTGLPPLRINRTSKAITAGGTLSVETGVQLGGLAPTGLYSDGISNVALRGYATGNVAIQNADGAVTYANFSGTGLTVAGNITTNGAYLSQNGMQFGGAAATGVYGDSSGVALRGYATGSVSIQNASGSATYGQFNSDGLSVGTMSVYTDGTNNIFSFRSGYTLQCAKTGIATISVIANSVEQWNFVPGSGTNLFVGNAYKPGGGAFLDNSDARIKTVTGNYDNGLASILTLRPVRYTFKGNETPIGSETAKTTAVPFADSPHNDAAAKGTEFIGLVAQDCEAAFPEMIGMRAAQIDGVPVTDLRTLDPTPLIFALVNAVKELSARLEALEGAGAARGR